MNISSATMKKSIITFSFFFFFTSLFAQDYYWVGGSGNWSDYDNHWATSSGGTTFHTQAPTSSDNVIFDVNSFDSFGQVVTLDEHANCLSMDWTGVTNFPVIDGNDHDMNIYGSLTLSADMTADFEDLEALVRLEMNELRGWVLQHRLHTLLYLYRSKSVATRVLSLSFVPRALLGMAWLSRSWLHLRLPRCPSSCPFP